MADPVTLQAWLTLARIGRGLVLHHGLGYVLIAHQPARQAVRGVQAGQHFGFEIGALPLERMRVDDAHAVLERRAPQAHELVDAIGRERGDDDGRLQASSPGSRPPVARWKRHLRILAHSQAGKRRPHRAAILDPCRRHPS